MRKLVLFGTQELPVELFVQEAAYQADPLLSYIKVLSDLPNIGDAHTVVRETMKGHRAHAKANLIFSKAIIRGSEHMECIPWRSQSSRMDDLDVMTLPFTGALSYMLYGIDTSEPLIGLVEGVSAYERLSELAYPSLFPSYVYLERAVATEVYDYFSSLGRARKYMYTILKRDDLIEICINILKNYYTSIDKDTQLRLEEMFLYPNVFFGAKESVAFRVPNDLKRTAEWYGIDDTNDMPSLEPLKKCENTTLIHSMRPYGNMFMGMGNDKYIFDGGVSVPASDYVQASASIFPKYNYFHEMLRIAEQLVPRAFISIDEPITPLRYYDIHQKGHLVYAYHGKAPTETLSLEKIVEEMFPLNSRSGNFTVSTLPEAAKMYRKRMGASDPSVLQKKYILIDDAKITFNVVEDTSYKNEIVEPGTVSVSIKPQKDERLFEVSSIPVYYKTLLNEYAREEELQQPLEAGLATSLNIGLSVYVGVYIGDIQHSMVNFDGRRLNERDAFNHHKDRIDQYHAISGNRVMTNNGVILSTPIQIATRVKEEYDITTDVKFRN
jgi:hypothetical protein